MARLTSGLMQRLRGYVEGADPRPMVAMFALNAVDELDNATFLWVGPTIAAAFHKHVGDFGLINVFVLVVAPLIAVPVSLIADRRKRMPIALAAAATWGAFSLGTGLSPVLWCLIAARVGASLGRTVSYPVQLSLMADFYAPGVRTKALGVHAIANNIGAMLGAGAGAGLAALFGWRAAFFLLTIPTVLAIVGSARIAEPPRGAFEAIQTEEKPPLGSVFPTLYAVRSLRYFWFTGLWFIGVVLGATLVLPFYFKEDFGLSTPWVGAVGVLANAGGAVATYLGSKLAQDRLNISPAEGLRWLARIAFVIVGLLLAFAAAPTVWVAVPLVFVIASLFGLVAPLLAAVTTLVSPPELRSSAYAIGQIVGLGGAVFAIIITQVAQHNGNRWGFVVAALVGLRGTYHVLTAAKYANDDVERLDPAHVGIEERTDDSGRPILLETKGLTVSYSGVRVLFGVDIRIREGEIVALLGTNGAGKSTVLNAVCGLVESDGGNVWFDGQPITGETPERIAARGLVQAPGGRGIFPGLTVAENLRMGAFLLRGDKPLSDERLSAALELFPALRPLLPQRAGSLSGGERQMLVLAQAMLLRPKLLLIDELSLGLAPVIVQDLLVAVRRLNAEGVTIVLVEQSVNVALTLADRAYFLEKGEVRFDGATSELMHRNDLLRSVFLGGAGGVGARR